MSYDNHADLPALMESLNLEASSGSVGNSADNDGHQQGGGDNSRLTTGEEYGMKASSALSDLDGQLMASRIRFETMDREAIGSSTSPYSQLYIKLRIEEALMRHSDDTGIPLPLNEDIRDEIRILFCQWYMFCRLEIMGEEFLPVCQALGSPLWKTVVEENGCGFEKVYMDTDPDFDILNWFVRNSDTLGIRTKYRRYRDKDGKMQMKYQDLPRDGCGFGTARVLRLYDDNSARALWEVFGTVGLTARPMLREQISIRKEVEWTRKVVRGMAAKDECMSVALKGIYEMVTTKVFTPLMNPFDGFDSATLTGEA